MSRTAHLTLAGLASLSLAGGLLTWSVTGASADPSGKEGINAQKYEIGLFGDMPYGSLGAQQYPNVLADMNSENLAFSVFDGDIKDGSSNCYADIPGDNAQADSTHPDVYKAARDSFNSLKAPLVFVPGDNEWTDCDRAKLTQPVDSLGRLEYERQVLFGWNGSTASPTSLGQRTLSLTRESQVDPDLVDPNGVPYMENTRWTFGPVTYVGLNVPGSDNNWIDGTGSTKEGNAEEARAEYTARNQANLVWLQQSFAAAKAAGSKAVMIVLQADMFGDDPATGVGTTADPTAHFADTKAELARQAIQFDGKVVLVNGDSHYLTIDQPLTDAAGNPILNVTRVMTYGSTLNHWVSVSVDPNDPNVFSFHEHVIPANEPRYVAPADPLG